MNASFFPSLVLVPEWKKKNKVLNKQITMIWLRALGQVPKDVTFLVVYKQYTYQKNVDQSIMLVKNIYNNEGINRHLSSYTTPNKFEMVSEFNCVLNFAYFCCDLCVHFCIVFLVYGVPL